ncbi:MarR family winged helix-turn-helix transcriptional regulator [Kribbella sp. NPDC026611]|uniref:MarR family winged helix-turn-helix transcriptional regulator n=1 Tax=Kribbella sp. NPDC026611 TaxID=3154911 RepID=UPI003411A70F
MTSVNEVGTEHIANLLARAIGAIRAQILATSEERFPGLRISHYRLLELIPDGGGRITDLAQVAAMTKQGLGQHIDYLQKLGFTESDRLSTDRRVRLVRRTARGDEAVAFSREVIGRVETTWAQQLGPERFELLREMLAELSV